MSEPPSPETILPVRVSTHSTTDSTPGWESIVRSSRNRMSDSGKFVGGGGISFITAPSESA